MSVTSSSNPFSDMKDTNPFSDPSVTHITARGNSDVTSNFNPFVKEDFSRSDRAPPQEVVRSATNELSRQQESLDRAADGVEYWQPNLQTRTVVQSERIKNYPPLPPCCPIRPCFYQDISLDIPSQYQKLVRFHYFYWIAYGILMLVNVTGCFAFFLVAEDKFRGGISFGISIGYFFVFIPCSYVCWFRPIYSAFRTDSSFSFFWYFIVFVAQNVILIVNSLGIFFYGTVGWINGFSCFGAGLIGLGVFMLVIGISFDIVAILGFVLIARVNTQYRHSNASFEQAKRELNQRIVNGTVFHEQQIYASGFDAESSRNGVQTGNAFSNSPNY